MFAGVISIGSGIETYLEIRPNERGRDGALVGVRRRLGIEDA